MNSRNRIVALTLLIAGTISAFCQVDDPALGMGFTPYGSYHGGALDSINLRTGFLNIHIPIVGYPQRGEIGYTAQLIYNPKGWSVLPDCTNENTCSPIWQWKGGGLQVMYSSQDSFSAGPGPVFKGSPVIVLKATTSDGATHEMGSLANGTGMAIDGTGLWYNGVPFGQPGGFSRDRRGVTNNSTLEDTNGNILGSPSGIDNFIDTAGRILPSAASHTATSDFSGCTGPLPISGASIVSFPGYNGATEYIKLCNAVVPLQSNFQTTGYYNDLEFSIAEGHSSVFAPIQSLVLFNGSSWTGSLAWTFEYSSRNQGDSLSVNYGDLTKITLPTGGSISYSWGTGSSCDPSGNTPLTRAVVSRTVDANDGSGPHTWTYNGGTVTDPEGNDTAHSFGLSSFCSAYETETQYFQGPASAGKLLKTVNTDFRSMPNPFDNLGGVATPSTVTNVFPIRVTTTWPNGKVSKTETDYDSWLSFSVPGRGTLTGSYGKVLETREYDYGNGAPGPLLRRTDYTYKAFDGSSLASSYLSLNLLDLVSSVTIYDGNGNQVSQTKYGYDEFPLQSSGVAIQHDSFPSSGNLWGNRTSESHWLNTTGAWLTTTMSYYDTGTPYQVTDPTGHITTNIYGTGFQSSVDFAGGVVRVGTSAVLPWSMWPAAPIMMDFS